MSQVSAPATQPSPFRIGRRRIVPLVEAVGPGMPTRAAFPTLSPALLAATGDHLWMASQGYAILGADRVIIVDTCLGGPKPRRARPRPGFDSQWPSTMEQAGIRPGDVEIVVNTHLHHDHVGWNTVLTGGELRPMFPNAPYLIARAEFAAAVATGPPLHITDSALPVRDAGRLDLC